MSKKLVIIFFSLLFVFSLVNTLLRIILGNLPWWFDPGRDMLLSLGNLQKPTLIGPSTGIPGVFYGVWWIWALSGSQLVSLDPRMASFLVAFLPYVILMPLFFKKLFNLKIAVLLWVLFSCTFYSYASALWNVHPAPLVFLLITYLLVKKFPKLLFLTGFLVGQAINFNVSFGCTVCLGSLIFLIIQLAKLRKISLGKKILLFAKFSFGVLLAFAPFIFFETRHGFNQIKVIQNTLYQSIIMGKPVVEVVGLTKAQILYHFLYAPQKLFYLPRIFGWLAILVSFSFIIKKNKLLKDDKKLLLLLGCVLGSMMLLYFGWRNPVWEYHFIGLETILLIFTGFLAFRFKPFYYFLIAVTLWAVVRQSQVLYREFRGNPLSVPSLVTKQYIVKNIYQDAGDQDFSYFAYNPAIYTHDYDYLFKASGKKYPAQAGKEVAEFPVVYLIIPQVSQEVFQDFVSYRTPAVQYRTTKEIIIPDGTIILRREKI